MTEPEQNIVSVNVPMSSPANSTLAQNMLALAAGATIVDASDYERVATQLQNVKAKHKEIDAARKELLKPIDEGRNRIQAFFRGPLGVLEQAEEIYKRKLADYRDEQERLRLEEQRKAEEKARHERERIAEQAREAERRAREKAEADRAAAAEAEAAGRAAEAEKLRARADKAEERGAERVAQLTERSESVVAPTIEREAPKVKGIKTRYVWKWKLVDRAKVNPLYLCPDQEKIDKTVTALKGDAPSVVGGISVWPETGIAAGSK